MSVLEQRLVTELDEAENKAIDALARYKFWMFGYWAAIWVHQNRIAGAKRPSPFKRLVQLAKDIRGGSVQSANVPPQGMDYWKDEDPEHPVSDWKYQVENGDTRLGYWEWAQDCRQMDLDMEGQAEVEDASSQSATV